MKKKVFVLGLDGASWNVLNPLINHGLLSNLSRLKSLSVYGNLRSIIPPFSPPAWSSFLTGCNPGKHGIFGFSRKKGKESYTQISVNAIDIKSPTIFYYLSALNKKVISINVPMTFPVFPVNGIMISGLMTPNMNSRFCYPEEIYEELLHKAIDYRIDARIRTQLTKMSDNEKAQAAVKSDGKDFIEDIMDLTEKRFKAIKYLIRAKEWDLFVSVFVGIDRLCHFLWDYLPLSNQIRNKRISQNILKFFSQIDDYLGIILEMISQNEEVTFIVMSDHGFGPYKGDLYLNNWLLNSGFLFKRKDISFWVQKSLKNIVKIILNKLKILDSTKKALHSVKNYEDIMKSLIIDWSKSKAYVSSINAININLKGRELHGSVSIEDYDSVREAIIQSLEKMTDDKGDLLVKKAHRKEEIYHGLCLEVSPDILIEFNEIYHVYHKDFAELEHHSLLEKSKWKSGSHSLNGIFLLHGKDINKNKELFDAEIVDIFPTILYALGEKIPSHLDGKVLTEAFRRDYLKKHKIEIIAYDEKHKAKEYKYSEDEKKEIEERLKSLGYM